jgi:serine-type D-Ala-D-Ala carboxypeptidase (penicillin-binding protein 5/6)
LDATAVDEPDGEDETVAAPPPQRGDAEADADAQPAEEPTQSPAADADADADADTGTDADASADTEAEDIEAEASADPETPDESDELDATSGDAESDETDATAETAEGDVVTQLATPPDQDVDPDTDPSPDSSPDPSPDSSPDPSPDDDAPADKPTDTSDDTPEDTPDDTSTEIVVLDQISAPSPDIKPAVPSAENRTPAQRAVLAGAAVLTVIAVALTAWAAKDGPIAPAGTVRASADGIGASRTSPSPSPSPVPPTLVPMSATTFTIAGSQPRLSWPAHGQAAIEVEGIGSLGTSGATQTPAPIASIAKTMTAYLILTDHPLSPSEPGPTITVTAAEAAAYSADLQEGQSLVKVEDGERLTERQALDALMLASADNMARILAGWDAGSVGAFVVKMNAAAATLGMDHTTYTDPSGLAASTVSTAPDQLKLGETVMRNPTFSAIVGQTSAYVPVQGRIDNWNTLLGKNGVIGIKTGSTESAGGCLLFAALTTVDGHSETILGAVLGVPGADSTILRNALVAADRLLVSAQHALTSATVLAPGIEVAALHSAGQPDVPLTVTAPVTVIGWPGLGYQIAVGGTPQNATVTVTQDGPAGSVATAALDPAPATVSPTGTSDTGGAGQSDTINSAQ